MSRSPFPEPRRRPRLTFEIFLYAICDVAGMVLLATGALWLAQGKALFVAGFPENTAQAIGALIGGLLLMVWSAAQILRALLKQPTPDERQGE